MNKNPDTKEEEEEKIDESLDESFPASDPPSFATPQKKDKSFPKGK